MKVSEKEVLHLINIARRYQQVCNQMDWLDHVREVGDLLRAIHDHQSDEIKEIE